MMKRGVIVADEAIGTILHLPWCVITDVDLETIDLEHTQVRMQRPTLTIEPGFFVYWTLFHQNIIYQCKTE